MKNILIIGANSAIAQAVAKLYANQNNKFVLIARNSEKLASLKKDLEVRGAKEVHSLNADLTNYEQHKGLIQDAENKLGHIDLAFLAHGDLGQQNLAEKDFSQAMSIFNINCLSHISLLSELANAMEKRQAGQIAAITSVAGDKGKASNYYYCAAKGAVSIFLDGLRQRLTKSNVSVINLRLGFVDTPMTKDYKKGPLWAKPEAVALSIQKAIDCNKENAYIPWFWFLIMMIIRHIPERIFKKMSM